MEHKHKYDKDGKQICCTEEGKINAVADRRLTQELGDKAIKNEEFRKGQS